MDLFLTPNCSIEMVPDIVIHEDDIRGTLYLRQTVHLANFLLAYKGVDIMSNGPEALPVEPLHHSHQLPPPLKGLYTLRLVHV